MLYKQEPKNLRIRKRKEKERKSISDYEEKKMGFIKQLRQSPSPFSYGSTCFFKCFHPSKQNENTLTEKPCYIQPLQ